jgi:hypothetical protein
LSPDSSRFENIIASAHYHPQQNSP